MFSFIKIIDVSTLLSYRWMQDCRPIPLFTHSFRLHTQKSATLLISCSRLFFSSATIKFSFHRLSLESIDGPYLFYSSLPNFRTSKTPKGRGAEKREGGREEVVAVSRRSAETPKGSSLHAFSALCGRGDTVVARGTYV
jgi:hypothetical protein